MQRGRVYFSAHASCASARLVNNNIVNLSLAIRRSSFQIKFISQHVWEIRAEAFVLKASVIGY
jgi:hypothetical protein